VLITGGAGFLGSHLGERLLKQGANVICVDNYFTGHGATLSACSIIMVLRLSGTM
jgi:UDP-glucuronate decarboxylase